MPEQKGKFGAFEGFLRDGLPRLVRENESLSRALEDYGMFHGLTKNLPVFQGGEGLPPDKNRRMKLLSGALGWGTPLEIMLMGRGMVFGGSDNWAGYYDQGADRIVVYKPLVVKWQEVPTNKILYRNLVAVMIHELVHFFNDQIYPKTKVYSEEHHLVDTFHEEAFAPLGREKADYLLIKEVLEMQGVD